MRVFSSFGSFSSFLRRNKKEENEQSSVKKEKHLKYFDICYFFLFVLAMQKAELCRRETPMRSGTLSPA